MEIMETFRLLMEISGMKRISLMVAFAAFCVAAVVTPGLIMAQTGSEPSLVKVSTYLSTTKLKAGEPVEVLVVVQVQKDWHINSNPANPDFLIPTEFKVVSTEGTKVTDIKYPKSETITMEGLDDPVHVYEGEVAIFGKISAPAEAAGKTEALEMQLHYQACNNQKCLPPNKVVIKGKIPIAAVGESVESQNQKIFEKYRPKKEKDAEKKETK